MPTKNDEEQIVTSSIFFRIDKKLKDELFETIASRGLKLQWVMTNLVQLYLKTDRLTNLKKDKGKT